MDKVHYYDGMADDLRGSHPGTIGTSFVFFAKKLDERAQARGLSRREWLLDTFAGFLDARKPARTVMGFVKPMNEFYEVVKVLLAAQRPVPGFGGIVKSLYGEGLLDEGGRQDVLDDSYWPLLIWTPPGPTAELIHP